MEIVTSDYSDGNKADRDDGHSDSLRKQKSDDKSKVEKKKEQDKRKLEPSLKWKALEVGEKGKKGDKHIRIKTPKKGNRERWVCGSSCSVLLCCVYSRISRRIDFF